MKWTLEVRDLGVVTRHSAESNTLDEVYRSVLVLRPTERGDGEPVMRFVEVDKALVMLGGQTVRFHAERVALVAELFARMPMEKAEQVADELFKSIGRTNPRGPVYCGEHDVYGLRSLQEREVIWLWLQSRAYPEMSGEVRMTAEQFDVLNSVIGVATSRLGVWVSPDGTRLAVAVPER